MRTIKEVKHAVIGIAFSPRGLDAGGKPVEEVNRIVSELSRGFDEMQVHPLKNAADEKNEGAFVLNEYFFIKYEEDAPAAKSKKSDA